MTRYGQHFLKNKNALKRIADALDVQAGDTLIEIGPGHGELTEELSRVGGAGVIAIEKDRELAAILKEKLKDDSGVEVIQGDALKILPELTQNLQNKNYKLTGNIPYYITGFLFRTIGEMQNKPYLSVFTIQKEVAERMSEEPPRMNRLAASVQVWAEPKILFNISANDFSPKPQVDSAVISLKTVSTPGLYLGDYFFMVKILFQQPRKTILNNLLNGLKNISREEIAAGLEKVGVKPEDRPQNLSAQNIVQISQVFQKT